MKEAKRTEETTRGRAAKVFINIQCVIVVFESACSDGEVLFSVSSGLLVGVFCLQIRNSYYDAHFSTHIGLGKI